MGPHRLSLGDGQVIHAWDKVRVDGYLDIEALEAASGWTKPSYTGWVPAVEILRGMTVSDNLTENGGNHGKETAKGVGL